MSERNATEQLKALFYRFQPMLVAYAHRYLRSEEDAREAVQDVFLGVWNNRGHLQLDEGLRSYLFTATRNKALNYLEKRKIEAVPLEAVYQQESRNPGVEEQLQAEELQAVIYDEVNRLPERCREVFLLSRSEGLSYKEIAERLSLSEKTVENQISIALKRLRARVYGEGESGNLISLAFLLWLLLFLLENLAWL
ncbi:MAG: RNA polymerase sigma-70 factor [Phaeodactylibacter sp.]|nr:RNA polymerase sigma-70 factor [Phaeodactylibacter sp.]